MIKKIIPFILLLSLQSNAMTHEEMYQKQIDFYKRMYEREKVKTTTMKNQLDNQGLLNKLKVAKSTYLTNKGKYDNALFKKSEIDRYQKLIYSTYTRRKLYGYGTNSWAPFYLFKYIKGQYLDYKNRLNYKYKILNDNLEQNLYDLADLIEEYQPNTTVEIDDNYNVYINDELLE